MSEQVPEKWLSKSIDDDYTVMRAANIKADATISDRESWKFIDLLVAKKYRHYILVDDHVLSIMGGTITGKFDFLKQGLQFPHSPNSGRPLSFS